MKREFSLIKIAATILAFNNHLIAQDNPVLQSRVITDNKSKIDPLITDRLINIMNAQGTEIGLLMHAVNAEPEDPRDNLLSGYGDAARVDIGAKDFWIEHFKKHPPSSYNKYIRNEEDKNKFYYEGIISVFGKEKKDDFSISFGPGNRINFGKGSLFSPGLQEMLLRMCMYLLRMGLLLYHKNGVRLERML